MSKKLKLRIKKLVEVERDISVTYIIVGNVYAVDNRITQPDHPKCGIFFHPP